MKVLHFYKTYLPDTVGGTEQVIFQLNRGCGKFGIDTRVLIVGGRDRASTVEVDGHVVHRARRTFEIASTPFSWECFRMFAKLSADVDLVHYHYPWPFMDLVHFATRLKKPTVVTYHSDIVRQARLSRIYAPLRERFLASVDRIVATSPNYLSTSDVLARHKDKTRVIPIGLDFATYPVPDQATMDRWRARYPGRFFLFVGVIRYYKGLHILLDAVQGTDYPVVIVGSGPVERELMAHAATLGLRNVHFLGTVSEEEKVALLKLAYAVAFPSHLRSEAFGITLLEGAMYAKPMISSEIGTGTSYINIDGLTGLVVPPSDPASFRAAMRALWENPDRAADMGRRARERYWQLFTADRMSQSYAELYSELVPGFRPVPRDAEESPTRESVRTSSPRTASSA